MHRDMIFASDLLPHFAKFWIAILNLFWCASQKPWHFLLCKALLFYHPLLCSISQWLLYDYIYTMFLYNEVQFLHVFPLSVAMLTNYRFPPHQSFFYNQYIFWLTSSLETVFQGLPPFFLIYNTNCNNIRLLFNAAFHVIHHQSFHQPIIKAYFIFSPPIID